MRSSLRRAGVFMFFVSAILAPGWLQAQDDIRIVGSGIVQPVLQAMIEASAVEAGFNLETTGTTTGFASFCAGEADITTATRSISSDETALCSENQVVPLDLIIGHNILAFIGNPADTALEACLTGEELNTIYAPSAEGAITNWNQVLSEGADLALTAYAPGDTSPEFAILDALIEGAGIRSDAVITASAEEMIDSVSGTAGAVGVVTLSQALNAGDSVRILELDAAAVQGCQIPGAVAVEDNLYPAAESLHVYVNSGSLEKSGMSEFLDFVLGDEAPTIVAELNFTPPTDITLQTNRDNYQAAVSGELPAQSDDSYTISPGLTGQVGIGGAGEGFAFLKSAVDAFNAIVPNVTVNLNVEGLPAGVRRLCNGEIDLVYSYRALTDDETANCESNNITLLTIELGTPAVILLANGSSDYLGCLTTDQITTLWQAESSGEINNWNQINSEFPDAAMTLFSPEAGSAITDLLLLSASGSSRAGRVDVELDNDPLYRAAATANVEGALTFMDWFEYQSVLANNQANIQLVAVDAGEGCVTPDLDTVRSRQYPLTRPGYLIINQNQLARPDLQSLLWFTFGDDQFANFESAGFVGLRLSDLAEIRSTLLAAFDAAQAAAAEATPEATSEATAEATAETE